MVALLKESASLHARAGLRQFGCADVGRDSRGGAGGVDGRLSKTAPNRSNWLLGLVSKKQLGLG